MFMPEIGWTKEVYLLVATGGIFACWLGSIGRSGEALLGASMEGSGGAILGVKWDPFPEA